MNQLGIGSSKDEAFSLCWEVFKDSTDGIIHINELENFIIQMLQKYSPEL
ncbi:hypothetical protein [Chryseobacterium salivictor]|nr:hypothetical protein [Chryseobacterium salivictor]